MPIKTLLIILNLAGGQPTIIDYPDAPACKRAKAIAEKETGTGGGLSYIRFACIPAP